ncbi:MAG: FecR domain-containing protein [Desulfobacterales bacterium]|jgi:hypothetical protein
MPVMRKKFIILSCFISLSTFWTRPSISETAISEKTLSSDIVVKESYQPGGGLPVGEIKAVRGDALVFHRDPAVGYRLRTGLPLYPGDIIRTGETGWISCRLVDRSRIALMSQTTLVILQSNYNSTRKTGASLLQLIQGDARFKLMPLPDLSSYEFKLQTEAAAMMTGNADFVVIANPRATEIIAFAGSRLKVSSTAAPEQVFFLSDFQRTVVGKEAFMKTVETVSLEDAETIKAEFNLTPQNNLFATAPKSTPEDATDDETPGENQ